LLFPEKVKQAVLLI